MPAINLTGQYNITFVHIPKTAGSSVGQWMKEHLGNSNYIESYNHPKLESITKDPNFSFTIVRNPWDRTVSLYHWLKNIEIPNTNSTYKASDAQTILNNLNSIEVWPSFEEWVKNIENFKMFSGWWFTPVTPQVEWVNGVTSVLRYENLDEDFKQIQQLFDTSDKLTKILVTDHTHYRDYYNNDTKNIITKLFEKDIDTWKYTF